MAWEQEEWLKSLEHDDDTGITAEVDGITGQSDGDTTDTVAAKNFVIEDGGGDEGEVM